MKLAEFYSTRRRPDKAARIYEAILQHPEKVRRCDIQKALADVYCELDRIDDAIILYGEAMRDAPKGTLIGPIFEGLGDAYFKKGDYNQAIYNYEQSKKDCLETPGQNSYEYVVILNNIASCHLASNNIEQAQIIATDAIKLCEQVTDDDRIPDLLLNLHSMREP